MFLCPYSVRVSKLLLWVFVNGPAAVAAVGDVVCVLGGYAACLVVATEVVDVAGFAVVLATSGLLLITGAVASAAIATVAYRC